MRKSSRVQALVPVTTRLTVVDQVRLDRRLAGPAVAGEEIDPAPGAG